MMRHAALGLLALPLLLGGCGGTAIVMGLAGAASVATILKEVVEIDVSLSQSHPEKTPIAAVLPR